MHPKLTIARVETRHTNRLSGFRGKRVSNSVSLGGHTLLVIFQYKEAENKQNSRPSRNVFVKSLSFRLGFSTLRTLPLLRPCCAIRCMSRMYPTFLVLLYYRSLSSMQCLSLVRWHIVHTVQVKSLTQLVSASGLPGHLL